MNNKLIVKEYIEKVLNTGDISQLEKFVSIDYTEVFNNQRFKLGIEGAKEHILGVRKNYPDIILSINRQICEGEWVVTCYTMKGTHSGSWMGIKPTGKIMEVTGINVDRIVEGKIIEHGGAANMFEGLLSIGAIKLVKEKRNEN
jgi:predicted ester cyclase